MTREEALVQLRLGPGINEDVSEEYNEAVDMAIEVLEQQPNEDCISRKAVLDSLRSWFAEGFNEDRWWNSTHVLDIINKAPSVEALQEHQHYKDLAESYEKTINKLTKAIAEEQQKTGHWIGHKHGGIEHIECSECGVWFLKANLIRKSYCPNCGSCNGDMIKNIMRDIANNNGGAK